MDKKDIFNVLLQGLKILMIMLAIICTIMMVKNPSEVGIAGYLSLFILYLFVQKIIVNSVKEIDKIVRNSKINKYNNLFPQ